MFSVCRVLGSTDAELVEDMYNDMSRHKTNDAAVVCSRVRSIHESASESSCYSKMWENGGVEPWFR